MADERGSRLRPFLLGGLVGGAIAIAAERVSARRVRRASPRGLEAFERAPCYQEALRKDRDEPRR